MSAVRLGLLSLLALAILGRTASAWAPQSEGALPRHPREIVAPALPPFAPPLPRRIQVEGRGEAFLLELPGHERMSAVVKFRAGAATEPAGRTGTARLLADVMRTAGSAAHPGAKLDRWLVATGSELTIEATDEALEARFDCPRSAFGGMVERVGSILRDPVIDDETLDAARRRLATREATRRADPAYVADWALGVVAYGAASPYARRPSADSLAPQTAEGLAAFHAERVAAAAPVVGLIGDPGDELVAAAVDALFPKKADAAAEAEAAGGDNPPPGDGVGFAGFIQPARTKVWIVDRPHYGHSVVRVAAPGVRHLDPDAADLELWSRIVGSGGRTHRLGQRFPDRSVHAGFQCEWTRAGTFLAAFEVPTDEVRQTVSSLLEGLAKAKTDIDPVEVDRARARAMNEEIVAVDTPAKTLDRFLDLEFHRYPEDFFRQRVLAWRNTDAESLQASVTSRLDLKRLVIVAVGPYEELAQELDPLGEVAELRLERTLAPGAQQPTLVANMFSALGGREAWAEARAIQAEIDVLLPDRELPSRQWSDLEQPRLRAEYLVASEAVVLLVDGERAVQVTTQGRTVLEGRRFDEQLAALRDALWPVLHRMASGSDVQVRLDAEARLVVRGDDGLDVTLTLGENGLPASLVVNGRGEESLREFDEWSLEGPLAFPGRIREPARGIEWRVQAVRPLAEFDPLLLEAP